MTKKQESNDKIQLWEMILLGAILLGCLLLFYQQDIVHTGYSSFTLLKGHWLDFYEYNDQIGFGDSYMPSTYVLFALWSAVPYFLGWFPEYSEAVSIGVYFYFDLLPVLFYIGSGYVVYRIASDALELPKKKARLCTYATMTIPVALFSQFIFCQYDVFTVFFVLLGTYFYLKEDNFKFILFFAISFTFKYFSLAIFVPMVLLRQKNVFKIAGMIAASSVLVVAEVLIHLHDAYFVFYVLNFSVLSYIFSDIVGNTEEVSMIPQMIQMGGTLSSCSLSMTNVSTVMIGVKDLLHGIMDFLANSKFLFVTRFGTAGALCIWAYLKKTTSKLELFEWVSFLGAAMFFAVFGFMFWHPQWLLMFLPFWGISGCLAKDKKVNHIMQWTELAFMFVFVMYVSNQWFRELDQGLLKEGIFRSIWDGQLGCEFMVKDFYHYYNAPVLKLGTSVLMLELAILRYPGFMIQKKEEMDSSYLIHSIRGKWMLGLASFLLPCGISACFALTSPYCSFNAEEFKGHLPGITNESRLAQVFTVKTDDPLYLEFYAYDYDRHNTGVLTATVTDNETGEIMTAQGYDVSTFQNRGWVRVNLEGCGLKAGRSYTVSFNSDGATPENSVTIYQTSDYRDPDHYWGLYNEIYLGTDLSIKIFERKK